VKAIEHDIEKTRKRVYRKVKAIEHNIEKIKIGV
jgi:hypothetical protein